MSAIIEHCSGSERKILLCYAAQSEIILDSLIIDIGVKKSREFNIYLSEKRSGGLSAAFFFLQPVWCLDGCVPLAAAAAAAAIMPETDGR